METIIDHAARIIEVWLPSNEVESQRALQKINSLEKEYKPKKYRVVVYSSGKDNLMDLTRSLIIHNKQTLYKEEKAID